MLRSLKSLFTPSLILLIVVGLFLGIYIGITVPPLIKNFQTSLESQQASTKIMLTGSVRLAMANEGSGHLRDFARELSQMPYVRGLIITDSSNRIVAGTWLGEDMSDSEEHELLLRGGLQRWPLGDWQGQQGAIYVSLDSAWPSRLSGDIIDSGMVILLGSLVLLLLLSTVLRDRLANQISALRHAATRIAGGDHEVRVPVRGKGPIAELTKNFNKMAVDLGAFTSRLSSSEERFALAINGSNEGIWDWDVQSDRLFLSPRLGTILGYHVNELPGMFTGLQRLIHPEDRPGVSTAINAHLEHRKVFRCEFRMKTRRGTWLWILGRGEAVRDKAGQAKRMAGSLTDISDQKATQLALQREKERVQVTLQSIADAVITTDNDGRIQFMNPAAERLTGWTASEAVKRAIEDVLDFLNEYGSVTLSESLKSGLQERGVVTDLGQTQLLSRTGEKHVVEHNLAPLRDRGNRVIGVVIVIHDVTDRFKLMQQLSHQAIHDPLTQLINRTGFELKLSEALKSAAEGAQTEHAICYLDLDQFKVVNDTCGHSAGDELLRQIAVQLKQHARKGDTLARLGGDEFGLLLCCCPVSKAEEIAEKMRHSVEAFRFSWEGKSFSVGVSIGIAPFDGAPGTNAATILSTVDQACYIAKSKGRNRVHTYQPGDNESSRWHSEMQWVPHIHQAMDEGQFVLMAQPIVAVDRDGDSSKHYEILLRMRAANGDLISPGSFLPAAERYDLMGTLDRWVVGNAIDMLAIALGSNRSLAGTMFGINISGAVLTDNSLLTYVKEALAHYSLPPSLLCFEITETVAIANFTHANRFVNELKDIGCRFALDDFGSGFASFSYLKTLPVDFLKIDGSFVRYLHENDVDHTMVDIINQLGHVMGLKTIAEFVENGEILESLQRIGVDYAQGYHVGRPIPLHDVCYGEGSEQRLRLQSG